MTRSFIVFRPTRNWDSSTQPWNASQRMAKTSYHLLPPSELSLSTKIEREIQIILNHRYWKKFLNYVFGGFNFLMWIAFIVTIVCFPALVFMTPPLHPSVM